MKIIKIAFSIYAVTDMKRSRAFYEGILGLKPNSEFDGSKSSNWIEYDIADGTLALGCSPEWKPSSDGASVALEVDDFDAFAAHLKSKGVKFRIEPMAFPSCSMAAFYDPDMNLVTIHKKKAK